MSKDFEELFAFLKSHGARALVIGGHAVAFHSKPRFTKDIDIFVELRGGDRGLSARPSVHRRPASRAGAHHHSGARTARRSFTTWSSPFSDFVARRPASIGEKLRTPAKPIWCQTRRMTFSPSISRALRPSSSWCGHSFREEARAQDYDAETRPTQAAVDRPRQAVANPQGELVVPDPQTGPVQGLGQGPDERVLVFRCMADEGIPEMVAGFSSNLRRHLRRLLRGRSDRQLFCDLLEALDSSRMVPQRLQNPSTCSRL